MKYTIKYFGVTKGKIGLLSKEMPMTVAQKIKNTSPMSFHLFANFNKITPSEIASVKSNFKHAESVFSLISSMEKILYGKSIQKNASIPDMSIKNLLPLSTHLKRKRNLLYKMSPVINKSSTIANSAHPEFKSKIQKVIKFAEREYTNQLKEIDIEQKKIEKPEQKIADNNEEKTTNSK